jgi:hypothetical protein
VRGQVTKVIELVTWYFTLLLTIFIVQRKSGRKKLGEGETMAMAVIAMESTSKDKPRSQLVQFDTDSMTVGVDNRGTVCISDRREHFVGELTLGRKIIKGFHRSKPLKSCQVPYNGNGRTATG